MKKINQELLNPKLDYVFKRIFGRQGNESITKNFLSAILNQNITDIILEENTSLPKDMLDDKVGILDVKAKIDGSINCDIEMQIVNKKNIEKRILFYCSKMYVQSIKSGKDYLELEKSIAILITDYEIPSLKEIKKYVSKWNLREEDYGNLILTDAIEIVIIELPKFEKYKNNTKLAEWVKFINNPRVINMENKEIKKAKEVLDEISKDKHERYLAELREKYIMDQKAVEAAGFDKGLEQGIEQGIEQGKNQGIKQGEKQKTFELAKKMKQKNIPTETIEEITGLAKEEIEKL